MSKYKGKFMNQIHPSLLEGKKERVLIVHNKYVFYSNDGKYDMWTMNGNLPLKKKENKRKEKELEDDDEQMRMLNKVNSQSASK